MKILYYLPSLYTSGGLERIITLKANYLAEKYNYHVIILTSEQKFKAQYFHLSDKIKLIDLNVSFDPYLDHSRTLRLLYYPFHYQIFKRKFCQILEEYRPDISISTLRRELNFIHSIKDGSVKIGEFHVTRQVYHSGSIRGNSLMIRLLKKYLERSLISNLKKLSKVILLTMEEKLNWPELSNAIVIHNPLSFFPEISSTCEKKIAIAVGRFTYQKGFDLLVESWKEVNQRHPDWQLHIYGEGEKMPLLNQVHSLGLSDSCFLQDPVENIQDKYVESSIFILSSRFEGFGMVIAEAMACGVPPVSFACPCGPRDIITSGEDGLLAEPENTQDLARKICYLIENEAIRIEMGKKARKSAERFRIDKIMNQWKELFESILEQKVENEIT